ncbi:MAG: hypothetical protein ABFS10_13410 [Bacteroidota bacterium]
MKRFQLLFTVTVFLFAGMGFSNSVSAQIYRVGAGLSFASGYEFNNSDVGNPGFKIKTWIPLDRKSTLNIVPTLSAFNRSVMDAGRYSIMNYLFMGDLDGQYMFYEERTLKMVVFAGANFTYLNSVIAQNDPKYPIPDTAPGDLSDYAIGGNLGAGLEMRLAPRWDMNVSVKYILSKYSQFIISVEGVYYFKSRRSAYWR